MTERKRNQPDARRIARLSCQVRAAALVGTIMLTISTVAQSSEVSLVIQNACRLAVAQQAGSMHKQTPITFASAYPIPFLVKFRPLTFKARSLR
jgi:hypothetical protein